VAPKLFEPITIKGVTARNRVVVSPMCQYASHEGSPSDWHFVHLGRYAVGGAGIIFYEETAIEDRGRKTHQCAGLYRDEQISEYRRLADFVKGLGAVPAMQLGHAGSKASAKGPLEDREILKGDSAWTPISASNISAVPGLPVPRAMTEADVREVVVNWGAAARRAHEAGFDILEIHGAHGYLIQQFLSPVTNDRTDIYGRDIFGRMRFALEVTREVRRNWPEDKPLFFRVSAVDGEGGIWSLDDTICLSSALKEQGVDVIDCSSGGIRGNGSMGPVPRIPGYHITYAKLVKDATGMLTMAPGFITQAKQAEELLQSGVIDLVGMARELMYNSEWPVHAAKELGVEGSLEFFPPHFTYRLKDRERARGMAINQPGAKIPLG
jgi:2,4-dienoyl-CoA reductase-like NADH-dependent reductase (Old Yellow Enzyme family)